MLSSTLFSRLTFCPGDSSPLMSNNPYPSESSPSTGIDTPSVIIYSPRTSADDLICPLSPTSSLKGVYVRSRPTSMEVPTEYLNFVFGGFCQTAFNRTVLDGDQSTDHGFQAHSLPSFILSNESEPILTPATSSKSGRVSSDATPVYTDEEYIQKNAARRTAETRARVKALNESHARARKYYAESISPSVKTTASKNTVMSVVFGRKGDQGAACQNIEEGDELASAPESMKDQTRAQKKRTIPLVHRVTQKVYGVFHRKTHSTPQSIQVGSYLPHNDGTAAVIQEPKPTEAIKSSSISLFTGKRRSTIDSQQEPPQRRPKNIFPPRALSIHRNKNSFPAAPNTVSLTSTSLAIENRARLRRSISFAGFIDLPELDDELDEATAEATLAANKASAMARWANLQSRRGCDSDGVENGYIFERNVE